MILVTSVEPEDAETWASLRARLWPAAPGDHARDIAAYFTGDRRDPAQAFLARTDQRDAVGFIELSIRPLAEGCAPGRIAYLEGWYVTPGAQRGGVGRALVARAEDWARSQGCAEFASDADLKNDESAAAHRALGFEEVSRQICFRKTLASRPGSRTRELPTYTAAPMTRRDDLHRKVLATLKEFGVLMLDGHFDYGNGYHGRVYLNPHHIFRQPSLIWRLGEDLIDMLPESIVTATDVVAGPVMGGALLGHTIAGLLDSRRSLSLPPTSFAPLSVDATGALSLRPFYRSVVAGRRVLLTDDVRNTGKTFERAKAVVEAAGGSVIATAEICDRLEAIVDAGVPNVALTEYGAPENFLAAECPLCQAGVPISSF